mmetsp:Transcript_49105/g.116905  ORF Transcript_49105/g.116905 Transcript_49105/m.116905 type:complete len:119 (+) Transcript_49105:64-420(+)
MAEEVTLKLVFANSDISQEIGFAVDTAIGDVKRHIFDKCWPTGWHEIETVERLRLFAGGRELGGKKEEDAIRLKDAKLQMATVTAVHVTAVPKSAAGGKDKEKEPESVKQTQCLCTLL